MTSLEIPEPYSQPLIEKSDSESSDISYEYHGYSSPIKSRVYSWRALIAFLIVSVIINITLLFSKFSLQPKTAGSKYADLRASLSIPFEWATAYADPNLTESGKLWEAINFDIGMVALPYTWTDEKDLPRAQAFPWDHDQGLYVLNGYHALHCLKNIHRSIREYEFGHEQSLSLMHITHCLDALREDIICQADDTPRYTTITKSPESAVGQLRQCRDWNKLEEWARERTSCYNYINFKADFINQFERFKFCPKNSPYWPEVRKHFGKPDDWFGED